MRVIILRRGRRGKLQLFIRVARCMSGSCCHFAILLVGGLRFSFLMLVILMPVAVQGSLGGGLHPIVSNAPRITRLMMGSRCGVLEN